MTEQNPQTVQQLTAKIDELIAERELHKGSSKGVYTKQIKALTSQRAQLQLAEAAGESMPPITVDEANAETAETAPAAPKGRVRKGAKFDTPKIVEVAATVPVDEINVEGLAKATGYEVDGAFKRRVAYLVKSGAIDARFLGTTAPQVPADPQPAVAA